MNDNNETRRVIVITGASAGLGRAIAQAFARTEGAHIGLIARGKDGLEGTRRDVENLGGRAMVLSLDVADPDAVEAAAERVEAELGPILHRDGLAAIVLTGAVALAGAFLVKKISS